METKLKLSRNVSDKEFKFNHFINIISDSVFDVVLRSYDMQFRKKCLDLMKVYFNKPYAYDNY